MIVAHKPDVNPDDYCYDTGLKFGADLGKALLDKFLVDPNVLAQDTVGIYGEYAATAAQKPYADIKEMARRKKQARDHNDGLPHVSAKQWLFPNNLRQELDEVTPDWLRSVEPDTVLAVLQATKGGRYFAVHCDNKRTSSLFMLLQGQGQETCWYRNTEPFDVISPAKIADYDKIEPVLTVVLQPYRWYVFNHAAWHGVSGFVDGGERVHVSLDFKYLSASDLVRMVKTNATCRET